MGIYTSKLQVDTLSWLHDNESDIPLDVNMTLLRC